MAIEHAQWGPWPSIRLSTDAVALEVVSEVGGRVVSLRDRRREREWLVEGTAPGELEQMAWAQEGAVFGGRESFGWDECLPTTASCTDPVSPSGPLLRDHGDQWGRGAYLGLDHERGAVEHTWAEPRWPYRLHRRLSFTDQRTVLSQYLLESRAQQPLPVSWAQHAVLALEPGAAIDLPEVRSVRRTWQHGIDLPDEPAWPRARATDRGELDLSCVRGGEGWAAVLYAQARAGARVVAPDGARLDFDWDRAFAPALRVWISSAGWPPHPEPCDQIALEPCTSMHDHLEDALADGAAVVLPAGGELRWWVRLTLS